MAAFKWRECWGQGNLIWSCGWPLARALLLGGRSTSGPRLWSLSPVSYQLLETYLEILFSSCRSSMNPEVIDGVWWLGAGIKKTSLPPFVFSYDPATTDYFFGGCRVSAFLAQWSLLSTMFKKKESSSVWHYDHQLSENTCWVSHRGVSLCKWRAQGALLRVTEPSIMLLE